MAGQVQLDGTLTVGPAAASDSSFPGGVDVIPLDTTPSPKNYQRREHKETSISAAVNLALDFTGIFARFVYLRSDAAITFRVNGLAADIPLHGVLLLEAPDATPITGITVSGTATIEYYITGNSS